MRRSMASLLFLSTMNGAPWGGSEELWSRAAALLGREGHDVTCAAFAWAEKEPRLQALRAAGCRVHALPNWLRRKRNVLERLVHEGLAKPAQALAVRAIPLRRFDHVLVSQGGWSDVTARPFRRIDRLARGYSLVYHLYDEDGAPQRAGDLRRLALGARQNLFAAHRIREVLGARLGVEVPRASVFFNPLTVTVPESPPPWNRAAGPLQLAAVAALDCNRKAQDVLLEALSGDAWRRREWRLDLYGEGRDRSRLEALIRERGLAGRVELRGHTSDVAGALARAHLVLQATRFDAMPIVVHEAMAMARPCLVTPVGDMARWIRDGETGFVAARAEPAAVASALEAAWAARDRWEEMGRRAREEFLARFPPDPARVFADVVLAAARGAPA
jgi:glycosyltransferase involved in cell wall biosynthesis